MRFQHIIAMLVAVTLLSGTVSQSVGYAASASTAKNTAGIAIQINGQRIKNDVPAMIKNDRTLVPLRGVLEKLGAQVQWNEPSRQVVVDYKDTHLVLTIDSTQAINNGITSTLDVAPAIYSNRTMVPLRFIAEKIGMNVQWLSDAALVTITDPTYFDNLPGSTVLGYTTSNYTGDKGSYNSLAANTERIDSIATFSYQFDSSGKLSLTLQQSQSNTVSLANDNGIQSLVLVHNLIGGKFNADTAHAVLSSPEKRAVLIQNILTVIGKGAYAGVNIDIENVYWYDRQNYSDFVKELKAALTPYGMLTTLSIPAKTNDNYPKSSWSGAFDYKTLGKYADRIMLMTYDEHYAGGSPGPVASLPWVESVIKYATSQIPSQKVMLGIAGYGYDWSLASGRKGKAVRYKAIEQNLADLNTQSIWDIDSKTPYYKYTQNGVSHVVWYENSRSLDYKLSLVNRYKLGGIGIWQLGYEDSTFWDVVDSYFG